MPNIIYDASALIAVQLGSALGVAGDQVCAGKPDQVERVVAGPAGVAQGERPADVILGGVCVPWCVVGEVAVSGANHSGQFGVIETPHGRCARIGIADTFAVVVFGEADGPAERAGVTLLGIRPRFAGGEHCPQARSGGTAGGVLR